MMKLLLISVLLITFLTCAESTLCNSADDCSAERCCMAVNMYLKGVCVKRAKLGTRCSEPESAHDYFNGKFHRYCPCAEGLECRPKNLKATSDWTKEKLSLRCQIPEVTTETTVKTEVTSLEEITTTEEVAITDEEEILNEVATTEEVAPTEKIFVMRLLLVFVVLAVFLGYGESKSCNSAEECSAEECCVGKNMLRKGRCERRGRLGARCNEPEAALEYYKGKFFKYCPCAEGLECLPKNSQGNVSNWVKVLESLRCRNNATNSTEVDPDSSVDSSEEVVVGEITEGVVEEMTKAVVEETTEGVVEEVTKGAVEEITKVVEEATEGVVGEITEGVVKETTEGVVEEMTKAVVEETTEGVVEEVKEGAVEEIIKVVEEETEGAVEEITKVVEEITKVVEEATEEVAREINENTIKKRSSGQGIDETDPFGGFDRESDEEDNAEESDFEQINAYDYELPDELIPV